MALIEERGISFLSLMEAMDNTTSGGRMIFRIFGAFAQFERDLIRERTLADLQAARTQGRRGGRQKLLMTIRYKKPISYMMIGNIQ